MTRVLLGLFGIAALALGIFWVAPRTAPPPTPSDTTAVSPEAQETPSDDANVTPAAEESQASDAGGRAPSAAGDGARSADAADASVSEQGTQAGDEVESGSAGRRAGPGQSAEAVDPNRQPAQPGRPTDDAGAEGSPAGPDDGEDAPVVVAPVTVGSSDEPASASGSVPEQAEAAREAISSGARVARKAFDLLLGRKDEPPSAETSDAARQRLTGTEPDQTVVEPSPGGTDQSATSETAPAPPADGDEPTFDIVRIGPDGRAVIAGRAPPGAEVEIHAGGRLIDRVKAGRRGQWVATPLEPLGREDRELSLVAVKEGRRVPSGQVVMVAFAEAPPPQPPPSVAAEPPSEQPERAGAEADPAERALAERSAREPGRATPSHSEKAIALLMREDGGVGRVLQAPGKISGDGDLALMVVDYDQRGKVQVSGEAPAGAPIRVYVDNRPAAEAITGPDGTWSTVLEGELDPGTYALRLDQLNRQGETVARLETPFTRAGAPAEPADGQAVDYVIVQPGNSLWRIANRLFGSGYRFTHIYESNRGQIRDPDLIYPGQVFEVPKAEGQS